MSGGQDDGAEKSFEATQHKLDEARKQGDFAKSVDLNTAAAYAGLLVFLAQFAGPQFGAFGQIGAYLFQDAQGLSDRFLSSSRYIAVGQMMLAICGSISLMFLLPAIGVLGSLIAQRAIVVAPSKLAPKLNRISPLATAKQKFGAAGLVEFFKSFFKMMVYGATLVMFILWHLEELIGLARLSPTGVIGQLGIFMVRFFALVLVISAAVGAVDYFWQVFDHLRKQRMTRQEVMDETKQNEGDPYLKAKRRQKGQEIAMSQMLADVPDATVVIVNPTHYAVALKWSPGDQTPPICVAKGIDEVAARIREVAAENGVPIRRDPPTARAIHASVDVGQPIDRAQFAAVAAAIRFAEDIRRKAKARPWKR